MLGRNGLQFSEGAPPARGASAAAAGGNAPPDAVASAIANFFGGAAVPPRRPGGASAAPPESDQEQPDTPEPGSPEARIADLEAQIGKYRAYDTVIEPLQAMGLHDGQAVHAAIAHQTQNQALTQRLAQLRNALEMQVEKRVITPEQALMLYGREQDVIRREMAADHLLRQNAALQVGQHLKAAVDNHPVLAFGRADDGSAPGIGEALVRSLHAAGYGDIPVLAKYVASYINGAQQHAVAEYAAKQGQASPAPLGGGGGAPPATQGAKGNAQAPWARLLGIKVG